MFNFIDFNDKYNTEIVLNKKHTLYQVEKLEKKLSVPSEFKCILHISHVIEKDSYVYVYDTETETDDNQKHEPKYFILPDYSEESSFKLGPCIIDVKNIDNVIHLSQSEDNQLFNGAVAQIKLLTSSLYEHVYDIIITKIRDKE